MSFRPRIVVATPHNAESETVIEWLFAEGFEPVRLTDAGRLAEDLSQSRLDLLAVDASFATAAINAVRPRHPQLPIVVFGDADRAAEAQAMARGAVYLTRPLARDLLVCTIALAITETRPVRRSERKPTRLLVVTHGVPSQIVDVSKEGLRLELPTRGAVPPPIFDVHVPLLGVDLNVRPGEPSHAALASDMTDVWEVAGDGEGATFPSDAPTARIDYLFAGPAVRALRAWTAGGTVSDHLMVAADLRLD